MARGSKWVCTALLWVLGLVLAACVDIDRQTTTGSSLPQALFGEWRGSWESDRVANSGTLVMSVQSFDGQPVLAAAIQHPCLAARVFEFSQTGLRWELRLDGELVFVGTVDPTTRTLVGTYSCAEDEGTWSAGWQGPLPDIPDLSGSWTGAYESLQPAGSGELSLDLSQHWAEGRLRFTGTVSLDPHSNHPSMTESLALAVTAGEVQWTGSDFQLLLQAGESLPWLTMHGSGHLSSLSVQQGLLIVENAQLPFQFGLWSAVLGPR